jgi:AcrR family transcriptional regulator
MAAAPAGAREPADRLTAAERREALLDATLALVLERGPDAVTMGAVAERSGVARGLVYKHFANKEELLAGLHLREASRIDREIRRKVAAAPEGFAATFEAYVAAVVEGVAGTSDLFAPLRAASAHTGTAAAQGSWDRRTVTWFAQLAATDFGLPEADARTAMSLLLGGVHNLVRLVRRSPGRRAQLERQYVRLVVGALSSLGGDPAA